MNENTIYKITCNANGMVYIGSTTDYKNRINVHLISLKNGNHISRKMQSDYCKYGLDSFCFEIISTNNDNRKEDKEFDIIRSLNPLKLYNNHKGITNMSERRRNNLIKALTPKIDKPLKKIKPIKIKKIKKKQMRIELTDEIRASIKQYRIKNGLSQAKLGELIGCTDTSIWLIERKGSHIIEKMAKKLQLVTGIILIN